MTKIRIGQIGLGHNHGAARMAALRKFPELFEITGIAPENDLWLEKRGSLSAYEGLPVLTEEEILQRSDAILVETEIPLLTKTAQKCADANKHILVDKPAGGTLEEFRKLLDTAKKKHLILQFGYMYRYNPAVLKLLEKLDTKVLGKVYSINAEMSACDPVGYRQWLNQFPGGGMYIFGSHMLDLVIRIMGKPSRVHCFYTASGKDSLELSDQALAVLEYPQGMARIYTSAIEVNGYGRRQLVVSGEKATVSIMPMERPCHMAYSDTTIAHHHHKDLKVEIPVMSNPAECRYDEEMNSFYEYIVGTKESPWTYEHDYIVQETLLKLIGGSNA